MFFPAEWHPQAFVQLTWPHKDTDWAPVLADAIHCFCQIAKEVAKREPLLIVAKEPEEAKAALTERGIDLTNIHFATCPTNDTWARDHAFLACIEERQTEDELPTIGMKKDEPPTIGMEEDELPTRNMEKEEPPTGNGARGKQPRKVILQDFQFNGWGLKFAANHDNQINRHILPPITSLYKARGIDVEYRNRLEFVFEGGSIESDGEGTLMATTTCLLAENRNNTLNQQDIEERLKHYFNAERVLWLHHSWLAGDDTDGHIDTIARFCSPTTIAYVKCDDPDDEHYTEMQALETELRALRTLGGKPYTLIPLPHPAACHDEDGNRLPATYANFLIVNGAVLLPTYAQPNTDAQAIAQLRIAFPQHDIVPIDCRVLILQHGSLHCSTMQYPI